MLVACGARVAFEDDSAGGAAGEGGYVPVPAFCEAFCEKMERCDLEPTCFSYCAPLERLRQCEDLFAAFYACALAADGCDTSGCAAAFVAADACVGASDRNGAGAPP
jgi:hypothetical protein